MEERPSEAMIREFEAWYGDYIRKLLTERMHGETVSHEVACERVLRAARRGRSSRPNAPQE